MLTFISAYLMHIYITELYAFLYTGELSVSNEHVGSGTGHAVLRSKCSRTYRCVADSTLSSSHHGTLALHLDVTWSFDGHADVIWWWRDVDFVTADDLDLLTVGHKDVSAVCDGDITTVLDDDVMFVVDLHRDLVVKGVVVQWRCLIQSIGQPLRRVLVQCQDLTHHHCNDLTHHWIISRWYNFRESRIFFPRG